MPIARLAARCWNFVAVLPLAGMLCLTGCGGGESPPSSAGGDKSATTPAPSASDAVPAPSVSAPAPTADQPAAGSSSVTASTPADPGSPPASATPSAPVPAAVSSPAASAAAAAGGTGKLQGVIRIEGMPPELALLVKAGDAAVKDADVCAMADIPNESIQVGADGGLANVFIYLGKAPPKSPAAPADELHFDQKGCRFVPHALFVRTGQVIRVLNSDAIPHNVHTKPTRNSAINTTLQPNDSQGIALKYERIEQVPVQVVCDIHPWMVAYQLPMDHPYVAVTDADGRFSIADFPAGKHAVRIWHEKAGLLEKELQIEVRPGEATTIEQSYPASRLAFRAGPAPKRVLLSQAD